MTLFAFAGKCGFFGASGFRNLLAPSAATLCVARKPSSPSSAASATEMKPPPACQRNSRRVRPQNSPPAFSCDRLLILQSIEIDELIQVQRQQAEGPQRLVMAQVILRLQRADESHPALDLRPLRLALQHAPQRQADAGRGVFARLPADRFREAL